MIRIAGRAVTILALCCAIGLHWVALQSLAWTTMVVKYAKQGPLAQAIAQTFDGAHPCSLCHAVNKGENSEKKSDLQTPVSKIDFICMARTFRPLPRYVAFEYPIREFHSSDHRHSPPVPPPRPATV